MIEEEEDSLFSETESREEAESIVMGQEQTRKVGL